MTTVGNALAYAESELQIVQLVRDAQELQDCLQQNYTTAAGLETECRNLTTSMDRIKTAIMERVLLENPEFTLGAHERAVKIAINNSDAFKSQLDRFNEIMGHRDALKAASSGMENNLKLHVARLNQNNGFMQFMAAAKDADMTEVTLARSDPF